MAFNYIYINTSYQPLHFYTFYILPSLTFNNLLNFTIVHILKSHVGTLSPWGKKFNSSLHSLPVLRNDVQIMIQIFSNLLCPKILVFDLANNESNEMELM